MGLDESPPDEQHLGLSALRKVVQVSTRTKIHSTAAVLWMVGVVVGCGDGRHGDGLASDAGPDRAVGDAAMACTQGRELIGGACRFRVRALAAADRHSCALLANNTVRCWGADDFGQSSVPADLDPVGSIATGNGFTCAAMSSGVRCWGRSDKQQTDVAADARTVSVVAIAAGLEHACAVLPDASVRCWGGNGEGQASVPDPVGAAFGIAAGDYHTCIIRGQEGAVVCWGQNTSGETNVPDDLSGVTLLTASGSHACAATGSDSVIRCWGGAVDWTLNANVNAAGAGYNHDCALTTAGLRCHGGNEFGQTTVPSDLGSVTALGVGYEHNCVATSAGVRCWGRNDSGQATVPADL